MQRTREQIGDLMHRALSGGERGLAGYWPLDDGSGLAAIDASGHGNTGALLPAVGPPTWVSSTAPVADEPPVARNVLGGVSTQLTARIYGAPAVAEYGKDELDAYGESTAVMKRALAYVNGDTVVHAEGFWVGDLDRQFIGQVQTEPTLVGFIEGAPPLPSENLTRPLWTNPGAIALYAGTSAVTLTESDETVRQVSSTRATGFDLLIKAQAGTGVGASAAVNPPGAWFENVKVSGRAGTQFASKFADETERGGEVSTARCTRPPSLSPSTGTGSPPARSSTRRWGAVGSPTTPVSPSSARSPPTSMRCA